MKTQLSVPLIVLSALLAGAASVKAAVVTLTANDANSSTSTSFNGAGTWNNSAAPSAANDYYTGAYYMRTPNNATNYTFAGHSLTLQVGTASGNTPYMCLIYKGNAANNVYTIYNLTNAGGCIRSGAGSGNICIIAGTMFITPNNGTIEADQSAFVISANISDSASGTGIITNLNPASQTYGTVTYTGTNSGFTGSLYLGNNGIIIFSNTASVPGNPASLNPGQITTLGATMGTLQDWVGVTLNNSRGGITMGGPLTIQPNSAGSNTIVSEPITDNGGGFALTKRGAGILTLSGNNTFSGGLDLWGASVGSQLNINSANAIGTGTLTINNGNTASIDNTSGGAITLANNNAQTWGNDFAFIGSYSLNMGTGTVSMSGSRNVTVSSNTLTVGTVTDNGSGFSLTKLGAGTLAIGGAASYTGATTVSGGTLACIGSALSSSTISIASGATLDVSAVSGGQTLAASGTLSGGAINGSITDNSGTVIYPGGAAVAGTLTVTNNLTLGANGSGSVTFDITNVNTTGGGVNDLIVVGGTLNIAGPTTINLNLLATPVGGVPYTLFQYGSLADGSLANLTVPTGFVLSTSGNAIQVTVTHIPVNLTWVGDGNYNYWDVDTTADWNAGQFFNLGDYVTFDDTGSDNPSINIEASTVSPSSVTVNATQTYDFIGYGIASGSLLKTNSGTLILENNNTYQGMTTIAGGVLQVGNPNTGGSTGTLGAGAVSNNASLVFGRNDTAYVVGNSISGSGSISMSGNGTVTLNASNTYTGATTVNSGILAVENRSALGSPAPGTPITVNNGGQLAILVPLTNAEPWVLDGSGNGEGALYKTNGATSLGGTITLGPDNPEIYVAAGSTLSLTNPAGINGVSANAILTLAGNGTGSITGPVSLGAGSLIVSGGTWAIAPSNNFSGVNSGYQVEISGGDLQISSNLALGPIPGAYNLQAVILQGGTLETTNNISFTDGNIGFYVGGNSTLRVDANSTLAISNQISGNANLTKAGAGTLALTGSNSFNGNFYVDTTSSSANDGITLVTSGNALANIPATPGTPTIHQGNNNSGYSTLQLNGSSGTITLPQEFTLNCRNNTNANIENIAGNNSIGGNIDINVGGSSAYFQSDAGTLVLAGTLQYQGTLANPRSFTFQGAGNITVSGPIIAATSAAAPVSILQLGTGTLTLSSSGNTYEGSTTISNGTLLLTGTINTTNGFTNATGTLTGTGTINDNVTILPGATVAPGLGGNGSIGTLTMLSNVTLSGIVSMDILDPVKLNTCDQIVGMTSIAYGGTLAVNNLGGTLNTSSTFTLFSASSYGTNFTGNFTNIVGNPGAGLAYSFNPTNGVLSVVSAINTNPPIIGYTYNAGSSVLTLSWATNSGWILQSNSISLANLSDWFNIAGSSNVTTLNITNNKSSPAVFYRLLYP